MSEPASAEVARPLRYYQQIAAGLDVSPILRELEAASDLWDRNTARTEIPGGPMAGTSDIWVRYFDPATLRETADYLREGRCVAWPAWHRLPSIHTLVFDLMHLCRGVELGGILISRIPPGGEVGTHTDGAAWSARFFDTKLYIPLQACEACINRTLDEEVVMLPGTVWLFDNLVPHSVHNRGTADRLNLIVSMRSVNAPPLSGDDLTGGHGTADLLSVVPEGMA